MKIRSKEDVIEYFKSGCKKNLSIGVENEKFIFDVESGSRANFAQISKVLEYLQDTMGPRGDMAAKMGEQGLGALIRSMS